MNGNEGDYRAPRPASHRRGYVRTRIARTQISADFRGLSAVSQRGAAAGTLKSFVILDGRPGLQE